MSALKSVADVAGTQHHSDIHIAPKSVPDNTVLAATVARSNAMIQNLVAPVENLVRFSVRTRAAPANAANNAARASSVVRGLVFIKAPVRCPAQYRAIDFLVTRDATRYWLVVTNAQVSAERNALLTIVRHVATRRQPKYIASEDGLTKKSISTRAPLWYSDVDTSSLAKLWMVWLASMKCIFKIKMVTSLI
ncbi:hypothetical protein ACHAQD_010508 [Fusarium lateritium]